MADYLVPSGEGRSEYVEKRSSFLGFVCPIQSESEAREIISAVKKEHHDARHNCWCYSVGRTVERYSDDGEPQGTAGIPMLEVFKKEGVTDFVCIVTRYFGGVLLGSGGLLRAYTKAAKDALTSAGISRVTPQTEGFVDCPYSYFEPVRTELLALGGCALKCSYGEKVSLFFSLPEENFESFSKKISDMSGGKIFPVKK